MERPLRLLSVLLAVGAVATLVLGAAGFTTVEANRTVDVAVVDDDEAYIGIPEKVELNSEPIAKNRFATDVEIKAEIAVPDVSDNHGGDIVVVEEKIKTLEPGDTHTVTQDVNSGERMEVTFRKNTVGNETEPLPEHISIELTDVQGDNIEASVGERTVEVDK